MQAPSISVTEFGDRDRDIALVTLECRLMTEAGFYPKSMDQKWPSGFQPQGVPATRERRCACEVPRIWLKHQ